jgi:hypothetical protein
MTHIEMTMRKKKDEKKDEKKKSVAFKGQGQARNIK